MRTDTGQVFRLEDYRPSDYLIPELDLTFRLDPERTIVTARLSIARREGVAADLPLVLDGDGLTLGQLLIDGRPAEDGAYEATPDRLTIVKPPKAQHFELTIVTRLAPANNKALMGLYVSNGVFCTQCEAEGFRRITYFLDRPDVLAVYRVRIEARKKEAPLLLSNGNPVEHGDLDDGWHYAVWHDPFPKPSYLFALVAGDLGVVRDRFVTASGRDVALAIYVEHGKEALAAYAMDALKRSMRWDEERFGREYDLDVFNIVAVSDFNMGAMENKGLNVFNDKYVLADPETATDVDFANIEAIIAHEYFHNWTGNRITCRDWFQLCLKEGLTVYRDHEFSADQRSRAVKRIAEVRTLRAHQFPEDQGPLAHPVRPRRYREINNFYTATVYEKGSEVVRMIRTILGAEAFRAGMDLYFERHDGQAVTIEDFLACFEAVSGRDLSQFSLWYHQAGTPNVTATTRYDPSAREYTVELEQSVPPTPSEARKRLMHIPLAFGLVGPDGQDMAYESVEGAAVEDSVIHLRKRRQVIRFKGVEVRPILSLNRGFSAPITLSQETSASDRLFLARHDSDLFSRWQALDTLLTKALIDASARIRGSKEPEFEAALLDCAAEIAADERLEPAYRALALTLPAEADIAREIGSNIDPDAIGAARASLRKAIAIRAHENFAALHRNLEDKGPFSPDAESAGRRALRNVLLDYLAAGSGEPALALHQFENSTNMTERMAALTVLAHQFPTSEATQKALAAFEERYRDNALVLDKWFIVQATIPGPDTVDLVRRLMEHEAFSLMNPNRVRSLIGSFASANQTGFNRVDGEGYRFLAETVLRVEAHNPQVAARLAVAFRSWRSLEKGRQEHARAALAHMAQQPELSRDLRDIVERTLA
ncbi:aminopeptidase N [Chelativorans sp. SCAU2101]|jgi:aminopeptidase N, Escherichia coli type|uniref:Aminopeptidase N n=1 Tax=Chelativorans petroleitrophicus TaxID=2975484 RepID=A0A9X3B0C2_9HYPH|nr:aminopeptidase N [Chelativorans petroleitrophicus]MCT8991610.1 aminopeptidase N [Chelativorans petroleitrophicus]